MVDRDGKVPEWIFYVSTILSFADGPLLIGDIISITLIAIAAGIYINEFSETTYIPVIDVTPKLNFPNLTLRSKSNSKSAEKTKSTTLTTRNPSKPRFTANPYDFNPINCTRKVLPGTKNGSIILWTFDGDLVFRWDQDLRWGSHYHTFISINSKQFQVGGHYYPGDLVPEPFASIFFLN